MDKWIYIEYVYNGIIYSYKKRGNATIYDNMDGGDFGEEWIHVYA